MPPFLQFIVRRLFYALISLVVITMVLYAGVMMTPPEARARLYLPPGRGGERASEQHIQNIIDANHLDAPFLVQYFYWAKSLLSGSWGYSPTLRGDVLSELVRRTPATLELAIYSLLLLIPLGLANGLIAGWRPGKLYDGVFRFLAFFGTSMPPFIFSMFLISIFYIQLHWFAPNRVDITTELDMARTGFVNVTGFLTLDSLINRRFDIFLTALRHLAMPVISLILFSWMPIARIVNTMVITLKNTEFIQAARALGGGPFWIIRRHLLPNSVGPALVLAARDVGSSVILQATITFIGLGGASPWGILLSLGRNWVIGPGGNLLAAWWVFLPATLAIIFFGVGWNLLGDGLTEALEPSAAAYGSLSRRMQKDDAA